MKVLQLSLEALLISKIFPRTLLGVQIFLFKLEKSNSCSKKSALFQILNSYTKYSRFLHPKLGKKNNILAVFLFEKIFNHHVQLFIYALNLVYLICLHKNN